MYSTIQTAILDGIHAKQISVEVDISSGLPMFDMVGYLSSEVREAKERVRTALRNCGVSLPAKRITVNLAPANIRKTGTGFDLPLAVALLVSLEHVKEESGENRLFIGELGLNGQILPVNGILPVVSDGMASGIREFILPMENLTEAKLVSGARVFGFSHLEELVAFLNGKRYREPTLSPTARPAEKTVDFMEVNGQRYLKRAAEVAAAGMHNLLMIGPPGAGKTMISERIATILPPLTEEECLEVSKIYSVCGLLKDSGALIRKRPFRSPHHTVSQAGLVGGGTFPRPGEISLSHHGVLFLDELPEFHKTVLEALRQPMEEHQVHICRANASVDYPADFLLLASMNPCNCGYYPDMQKCRCTPGSIRRYLAHVSQPLLDRMDICVEAPKLSYAELTAAGENESSATIRARVERCHRLQRERYADEPFSYNCAIPAARLAEFCPLGEKEARYLEHMYKKLGLTARTYHKILRVARTIADIEGEARIRMKHLNEAVCYRGIDEGFWGGLQG